MDIHCPNITSIACAGQFLHIKISNCYDPLLRRPLSICSIDILKGDITLLYRVAGKGTELLSMKKSGDTLNIMGPLGKGFPVFKNKKSAIIGGGIGIAPLLELSKHLEFPDIYLDLKRMFMGNDFSKYFQNLYLCTEDGRVGVKGFQLNFLKILKNMILFILVDQKL